MTHNAQTSHSRRACARGIVLACTWTAVACADVNLEWRPPTQTIPQGNTVALGLYAVSDAPGVDQPIAGMDVVLNWDSARLRLIGLDETGAVDLLFSGFPIEPFGLNEVIPPQDGDGFYQALAPLGQPVVTTPDGVLIATFLFEALDLAPGATVSVAIHGGLPSTNTVVWDGVIPNNPVTGTLGSASVTITTQADADSDGDIDLFDTATFFACVTGPGGVAAPGCTNFDLDNDGDVDFKDWATFQLLFTGG